MVEAESRYPGWGVVGALVLAALALRLPWLADAFVGPDAWRQADTAAIARNFLGDPRILWPRIDWGAPGPGFVEAELALHPFLTHGLYRLFGVHEVLGQLVSLAATGVGGLAFWGLAKRFLPPRPALAALAFFLCAPLVFRYSRTFMPDALALMFALLAIERFVAGLGRRSVELAPIRWTPMLTAAACMGLAILVKPTTIHLGLALVVVGSARYRTAVFRLRQSGPLLAFAVISLAPALIYFTHAAGIHADYGNTFGVMSGGDPKWGSMAVFSDPMFYRNLLKFETLWVAGPGVLGLAVLGLWRYRSPGWRPLVIGWGSAFVLYVFIVGRYAGYPRGLHYHLYAAPLLALAAGGGVAALSAWRGPRWAVAGVLAGLALQLPIDAYVLRQRGFEILTVAGHAAREHTPSGALLGVVAFDTTTDHGVLNNYQQPSVLYHADRRGRVLGADQQSAAHLRRLATLGVHWMMTFDGLAHAADPDFATSLSQDWRVAYRGAGFTLHRFSGRDPTSNSLPGQ